MKSFFTFLIAGLFLVGSAGCDNLPGNGAVGDNAGVDGAQDNNGNQAAANDNAGNEATADNAPDAEEEKATLEWLADQMRNIKDAGGETLGDSTEWVSDTFESLKDSGMTSADNAKDWVTSDFKNMYAWEYKVVSADNGDPAAMETKLNELGQTGWECFHVQPSDDGSSVFYFKKHKRSYLKAIPMKDLLKLLPMVDGGGEGE